MTRKVGTYYFARHRRAWGIWIITSIINGVTSGTFVKDVLSYEDAVRTTYSLNGWCTPKSIVRKY
jgi:hypothetical protein